MREHSKEQRDATIMICCCQVKESRLMLDDLHPNLIVVKIQLSVKQKDPQLLLNTPSCKSCPLICNILKSDEYYCCCSTKKHEKYSL